MNRRLSSSHLSFFARWRDRECKPFVVPTPSLLPPPFAPRWPAASFSSGVGGGCGEPPRLAPTLRCRAAHTSKLAIHQSLSLPAAFLSAPPAGCILVPPLPPLISAIAATLSSFAGTAASSKLAAFTAPFLFLSLSLAPVDCAFLRRRSILSAFGARVRAAQPGRRLATAFVASSSPRFTPPPLCVTLAVHHARLGRKAVYVLCRSFLG